MDDLGEQVIFKFSKNIIEEAAMKPTIISRGPKLLAAVAATSVFLSGCATEDYVNKHIAAVNARIDQTDAHVAAVEGKANEAGQAAAAANSAAQQAGSAAQAAAAQAQTATTEAARANDRIDKMEPKLAHMMHHHKHKTWRNVSKRSKHKKAMRSSKRKASTSK